MKYKTSVIKIKDGDDLEFEVKAFDSEIDVNCYDSDGYWLSGIEVAGRAEGYISFEMGRDTSVFLPPEIAKMLHKKLGEMIDKHKL